MAPAVAPARGLGSITRCCAKASAVATAPRAVRRGRRFLDSCKRLGGGRELQHLRSGAAAPSRWPYVDHCDSASNGPGSHRPDLRSSGLSARRQPRSMCPSASRTRYALQFGRSVRSSASWSPCSRFVVVTNTCWRHQGQSDSVTVLDTAMFLRLGNYAGLEPAWTARTAWLHLFPARVRHGHLRFCLVLVNSWTRGSSTSSATSSRSAPGAAANPSSGSARASRRVSARATIRAGRAQSGAAVRTRRSSSIGC